MSSPNMKKITLELEGLEGNAFALLATFSTQAKREGWSRADIDAVINEAQEGDYEHLLQTLIAHTE